MALREQQLPGPAAAQPRALRRPLGDEHRGAGRGAGRSAGHHRAGPRRRRPLRAHRGRSSRRSSGWARSRRPTCSAEIDKSRGNDVWRLVYGLGIRHVGERAAQVLAGAFGSIDAHRRGQRGAAAGGRRGRAGAGGLGARVVRRPGEPAAGREAGGGRRARPAARWPPAAPVDGPLPGTTYVLTGTLAAMSRDQAAAAIEALGGRVSNSVSKKTTGVIVGARAGSQGRQGACARRAAGRRG